MNRAALLVPLLITTACRGDEKAGDSGISEAPPVWCEGTTAHRYDITDTEDVDLFPDGLLEVDVPDSPTGRGVQLDASTAAWFESTPTLLLDSMGSLNELSGFGTNGGILVRFTEPVTGSPTTADDSTTGEWQLWNLSADSPERVPFEVKVLEDGLSAIVWPLRPLALGSQHAFVITSAATADDGGCITAADTTRQLLYGDALPEHPNAESTAATYRAALDTLGYRPDDVSVLTVYTTHDETQVWREAAAVTKAETVPWTSNAECTNRGNIDECTLTIELLDRRNDVGLVDLSIEPTVAEIPLTVWLPADRTGPIPAGVYGHGLGSRRSEGYLAARIVEGEQIAIFAMEAVDHGDHPSTGGSGAEDVDAALGFLGLDLTTLSINSRKLRGNFDQTNLDRLRLLNAIQQNPDLDGDGVDDIDVSGGIGYVGVSLGAILGSQLLSVSPEVDGAIYSVGGGRLMSIVTDTEALADFDDLIAAIVGSRERFDRLVPIAQHVVDPADSALWAAHLLDDRFDDEEPPSLLVQVAIEDEVVPKTSGHALARALGVPHMEPVVEPVALLTPTADHPIAGNGPGGTTQAFFQYDRTTYEGQLQPATHIDTPKGEEAQYQMRQFLQGWLNEGVPVAIDPYAELGTPAL